MKKVYHLEIRKLLLPDDELELEEELPLLDEVSNWSQQSSQALDTFLKAQYKTTSGVDYNGSPILPGTTQPAATAQEISPADKAWVDQLYNKYFDRPATSAELTNWAKETPASLEQFLNKEQKAYGYVSKEQGVENKARYDAAIAIIDSSNLPDDIKSLWKTTVGLYPNAADFDTTEILNTFNQIKSNTIDPYYKELADVAIKDVQTAVNQSNASRQSELEAQNVNAQNAITGAQSNLESTGMTFSGQGVEQLGTGSAYAAIGAEAPVQTPFAGIDPTKLQGSVGQNNRLIATSTAAKYASEQQEIGRTAENMLGSSALSNVNGLQYTPAGVNLTANISWNIVGYSFTIYAFLCFPSCFTTRVPFSGYLLRS